MKRPKRIINPTLIALCLVLSSMVSFAQVNFQTIASLPNELNEVSGMVKASNDGLYVINDGGNSPKVYLIDTMGGIVQSWLVNAPNKDWEDLAISSTHLFIGDFGNNGNSRKDLAIYSIDLTQLKDTATLQVETINFSFADQKDFPPPANDLHFDCEAFFYYLDTLYLFSKDRSNPFEGLIKMYKVPAKAGKHSAELIDTFTRPATLKEFGWITSADVSSGKFIILGSSFVIEQNFIGSPRFNRAQSQEYNLKHFSQKEGVCYMDANTCYITDEKFEALGGPRLFKLEWETNSIDRRYDLSPLKISYLGGSLVVIGDAHKVRKVEVRDMTGKKVLEANRVVTPTVGAIPLNGLKSGTYFAIIYLESGFKESRKFVWLNGKN